MTGKVFLASNNSQVGLAKTVNISTAATSWALNTFGMSTMGSHNTTIERLGPDWFIDDVTYTGVVPEPGAFALLATGMLGLLAYAWKKRK